MPETVSHYQLLDRIGAGALGEVYRARDTRAGRTVALRRIAAADLSLRARLLDDARRVAGLSHPHLAAVYEAGLDDDALFLASEFVPGDTLSRVIAGQPLNPKRAAEFAAQVADGLAEAHAHGFVHRDVCPHNIIVTPKGQAKLIDLGLAAYTRGGAERAAVPAGGAVTPPHGALHYLSPEQALGDATDPRTDIFSLGGVLYTMLTGDPPFKGDTADALAVAVLQAPLPAPSRRNAEVPPELDRIVARAMARSLDRRYQSAAEFAADLRWAVALLETRAETMPEIAVTEAPRPSGARTIVIALVLVAIVALGAWLMRGSLP